jgi:hypothetical protein
MYSELLRNVQRARFLECVWTLAGEAIFENPEHDFPKRIIYRKKSAREMSIDAGAGTKSQEYVYTRSKKNKGVNCRDRGVGFSLLCGHPVFDLRQARDDRIADNLQALARNLVERIVLGVPFVIGGQLNYVERVDSGF